MLGSLISEECLGRLHVITAVHSDRVATGLNADHLLFVYSTKNVLHVICGCKEVCLRRLMSSLLFTVIVMPLALVLWTPVKVLHVICGCKVGQWVMKSVKIGRHCILVVNSFKAIANDLVDRDVVHGELLPVNAIIDTITRRGREIDNKVPFPWLTFFWNNPKTADQQIRNRV